MKGCIFDLDGVICDTAKYHYLAWKKLADQLGIAFTAADNERLKGVSRMDSLRILLSLGGHSYSDEQMEKFTECKNDWYLEYIDQINNEDLLPGVFKFILELRKHNIRIALGSVSKNAPVILDRLGIVGCFDAIVDGNVVSSAKPDPEVFLMGARLLQLAPEDCIVFEDAVVGVEAAHNAGMKCVGVGSKTVLKEAELVITSFCELNSEKYSYIAFLEERGVI